MHVLSSVTVTVIPLTLLRSDSILTLCGKIAPDCYSLALLHS